jgi:hypothetical protein
MANSSFQLLFMMTGLHIYVSGKVSLKDLYLVTLYNPLVYFRFLMIGKNLSTLLEIDGIEKKIEELLNEKKNH